MATKKAQRNLWTAPKQIACERKIKQKHAKSWRTQQSYLHQKFSFNYQPTYWEMTPGRKYIPTERKKSSTIRRYVTDKVREDTET